MNIKNYLSSYDIKQSAFADKVGISTSHLSLIINEKRNPSVTLAKTIETITKGKVSALELLGLTKKKESGTLKA